MELRRINQVNKQQVADKVDEVLETVLQRLERVMFNGVKNELELLFADKDVDTGETNFYVLSDLDKNKDLYADRIQSFLEANGIKFKRIRDEKSYIKNDFYIKNKEVLKIVDAELCSGKVTIKGDQVTVCAALAKELK